MRDEDFYFNNRISGIEKDFNYLFEIIRGDYYLMSDMEGASSILRVLFVRLKALSDSRYKKLWSNLIDGINNVYDINDMMKVIEHFSKEVSDNCFESYNKSIFAKVDISVSYQTMYTIIEIIRFFDNVFLNRDFSDSELIAEFFYRFASKLFKTKNNRINFGENESLAKIISGIVSFKKNDRVLDPFIGSGGLIFFIAKNIKYINLEFVGEDIDSSMIEVCYMIFSLLNTHDINLRLNDFLEIIEPIKLNHSGLYNKIITHIPYNLRLNKRFDNYAYYGYSYDEYHHYASKNVNYLVIVEIIKLLANDGQAFIIAPSSILFSGGYDKNIRRRIVEEDLVEAVIEFSEYGYYKNNIRPVILVLNKKKESNKRGQIQLLSVQDDNIEQIIKAYKRYSENEVSRIVSLETISNRDYNLNFSHYDSIFEEVKFMLVQNVGVKIGDIVNVVKPIMVYGSKSNGIPYIKQSNLLREVNKVYLDFLNKKDFEYIECNQSDRILDRKAIIVALQGNDLKPTIFDPDRSNIKSIVIAPNCLALIPRSDLTEPLSIEYLYYQLYNPRTIRQVDGYKRGAHIKRITYNDLLNIVISKLEYEKQLQIIKDQEEPIRELERYKRLYEEVVLKLDREKVKAENRIVNMLIHNVSKHVSVIGHDIQIIRKVLDEHNLYDYIWDREEIEKYNNSIDVLAGIQEKRDLVPIGKIIERTINRLEQLEKTFSDTQKTVNLNLKDEDFKNINIKELINEIINDRVLNQPLLYKFCIDGEDAFLNVNIQTFKEMIHLLIDNAEKHAFSIIEAFL